MCAWERIVGLLGFVLFSLSRGSGWCTIKRAISFQMAFYLFTSCPALILLSSCSCRAFNLILSCSYPALILFLSCSYPALILLSSRVCPSFNLVLWSSCSEPALVLLLFCPCPAFNLLSTCLPVVKVVKAEEPVTDDQAHIVILPLIMLLFCFYRVLFLLSLNSYRAWRW